MGSLKMEEQKIVELIESVERLGSWAGEKLVELSNRPIVVTGVSVAVASLVSWKLAKCCLAEDKLEDGRLEEQLEEITPKQSAATEQKVKEETLSPEDKWNKHTEEFCKKQSIPSVQSYYNPRMEESYAERGWQTQRDTIDRSTRPSTTKTQSITTKKAPIRKTPRRPSPAKMSTMSTTSPLRSSSPTKLASSSKKLTPKTTPRKSIRKPYGPDFVF